MIVQEHSIKAKEITNLFRSIDSPKPVSSKKNVAGRLKREWIRQSKLEFNSAKHQLRLPAFFKKKYISRLWIMSFSKARPLSTTQLLWQYGYWFESQSQCKRGKEFEKKLLAMSTIWRRGNNVNEFGRQRLFYCWYSTHQTIRYTPPPNFQCMN